MNIIQTFWTLEENALSAKGGWLSSEFHWMSWALSAFQIKQFYPNLILHTNQLGKYVLIDLLDLPYSKVAISHEKLADISTQLWALSKIYTYSLQQEKFIHVDGDIYIWEKFSKKMEEAEAIAQNYETDFPFYFKTISEIKEHFTYFPDVILKEFATNNSVIHSTNTGVIGGTNLDLFKKYAANAFDFVLKNKSHLDKIDLPTFNIAFEQFLYYCLIKDDGCKLECVIEQEEANFDPTYTGFAKFESVPYKTKFIHALGDFKKSEVTCNHLARRLRKDYSVVYYKIIELCLKNNQTLFWKCYPLQSLDEFWTQQYKQDVDNYAFAQELFESEEIELLNTKLKFNSNCKLIEIYEPTYSQLISFPDITILEYKTEELDSLSVVFLDAIIEGNSILKSIELSATYFQDDQIQNLSNEFIEICLNRVKEFVTKGILTKR